VHTVEDVIGRPEYEFYDYGGYPDFKDSLGFTQRGCRLKCKFCVVPTKEGKNRGLNPISAIWRGDPFPRNLNILDNDFFGQPEWRERIAEIRDGGSIENRNALGALGHLDDCGAHDVHPQVRRGALRRAS
jgi:hypothetical protein